MAPTREKNDKIFIIDFDSTLVQVEALDELALISLRGHPECDSIVARIREITRQGMEGEISISESLQQRLALLEAKRSHIEQLVKQLKKQISPSFRRNKTFFKKFAKQIFVVTSGFREYVVPVVQDLGIKPEHVFANTFRFDADGNVSGLDTSNVLSQERGKVEQLKRLKPKGRVYVIGDGLTDYQMKESGMVHEFIAFTENIARQIVVDSADRVAKTLEEVLYAENLPMKLSYPKSKIKVLLLEGIHPLAVESLR
ncbi:MAG: HAD-IB family phosphatase, partial [Deltaproteobacteria bacterium]|nr:HAD-IB family phosphatase [Deltaproteobacteria bacterium]